MAEDERRSLFMTSSLDNLIPSGKSEAEVTNNRRLHSMYCTVEAKLTETRHRAASLRQQSYLFSRTRPLKQHNCRQVCEYYTGLIGR